MQPVPALGQSMLMDEVTYAPKRTFAYGGAMSVVGPRGDSLLLDARVIKLPVALHNLKPDWSACAFIPTIRS